MLCSSSFFAGVKESRWQKLEGWGGRTCASPLLSPPMLVREAEMVTNAYTINLLLLNLEGA